MDVDGPERVITGCPRFCKEKLENCWVYPWERCGGTVDAAVMNIIL